MCLHFKSKWNASLKIQLLLSFVSSSWILPRRTDINLKRNEPFLFTKILFLDQTQDSVWAINYIFFLLGSFTVSITYHSRWKFQDSHFHLHLPLHQDDCTDHIDPVWVISGLPLALSPNCALFSTTVSLFFLFELNVAYHLSSRHDGGKPKIYNVGLHEITNNTKTGWAKIDLITSI